MNAAMPKTRLVLRQILQLLLAVLLGVGVAHALIIAYVWQQGGSADPRCATGWNGYVEVHNLDYHPPRIRCEYRPQVGAP